MRYFLFLFFTLLFLNNCDDRGYGTQDIQNVSAIGSSSGIDILSTIPKNKLPQKAYIKVEFSSTLDSKSISIKNITLTQNSTNKKVDIELNTQDNFLYIQLKDSLKDLEIYTLKISNIKNIFGNTQTNQYKKEFQCNKNFWTNVNAGYTHSIARSIENDIYIWGFDSLHGETLNPIPMPLSKSDEYISFDAGKGSSAFIVYDNSLIVLGNNEPQKNKENNFIQVSVGYSHSVVIKNDGTLWSWGKNNHGQLGNFGIFDQKELTQEYTDSSQWKMVSAGKEYTIALKNDNTMWGWGNNEFGQIGYKEEKESRKPVQEDTHANDWKTISAGANHSVAIKQDGTLWSWGNNNSGELGDGTNISSVTPTQEFSKDTNWIAVSAGYNHTIALKNDGTIWSWGNNFYGELGLGNHNNTNIPTQIGDDTLWKTISSGKEFTLATKLDGTMWAWGYNAYKQLGLGEDAQDTNVPTEVK